MVKKDTKKIKSIKKSKAQKNDWVDDMWGLIEWGFKVLSKNIALTWAIAFVLWLLMQYLIIDSFIGGLGSIYYINIEYSIIYFVVFCFILLLAFLFWYMFTFSFIFIILYSVLQVIFEIEGNLNYIFSVLFIVSIVLLFIKRYRMFLKKYEKILTVFFLLTFIAWFFLGINYMTTLYKNVSIITNTETNVWKLYFFNWDYYFIEIDWKKVLLPTKEVEKIELLEKNNDEIAKDIIESANEKK